jgi:hypothetical protein
MEEMSKHGRIGRAALKAGMDRKTARKYVAAEKLPSEMKGLRTWRTREDPFTEHWPEMEERLREAPGLEAKTLLEDLIERYPDQYHEGQLRTLQRRVRHWRASSGPERDVKLQQRHRPGEAAQSDFTGATKLGVTIAGELVVHMLYVFVLPFSNWVWATVCTSESLAALRRGLQRALFQLGRVPAEHQTDNSTAATHRIPDGKKKEETGRSRPFNAEYLAVMRHFGMKPRTTAVGAKEQNGDVEASNGALKRRLEQALLLRGHRDFESVADSPGASQPVRAIMRSHPWLMRSLEATVTKLTASGSAPTESVVGSQKASPTCSAPMSARDLRSCLDHGSSYIRRAAGAGHQLLGVNYQNHCHPSHRSVADQRSGLPHGSLRGRKRQRVRLAYPLAGLGSSIDACAWHKSPDHVLLLGRDGGI